MQTQAQTTVSVENSLKSAQDYLFSLQYPDGYWWAELESNVTITAEAVLLHKIWGTDKTRPLHKAEKYLRSQQRENGSWELYYGDGGDLNSTVEAYMALRLLGVPKDDRALIRAKEFILARGGISKTRVFTKMHLALVGGYDWRGIPSIPPWVMLLPEGFPFTIYEMSSWARGSTVPLLIVFDRQPVYKFDGIDFNELYTEAIDAVKYELPRSNDWTDIFVVLDDALKLAENLNLVPFREEGLRAAEKWVLERQEATGDWGGIIPAMLNSMLALKALNYPANDPYVRRGLAAIDNFAIETERTTEGRPTFGRPASSNTYCVQPCISPVWDTAWAIRALVESGIAPDNPNLVRAGQWTIDKQILAYGDWAVKNKQGIPGGWAFEFENRFYPDLDDTAVVVMALNDLKMPDEVAKQGAIDRAVKWMATMQCREGGWAAFDIDNDADWLNLLPYADLKALIDPNTADVTARVLEMLGQCDLKMDGDRVSRAVAYLDREQESDGSWFGRWGVNYIYGTSGVLSALALIAPQSHRRQIERGAAWLVRYQNPDGGWGETCESYKDKSLKGKGKSTASQTAWAIIGLLAAYEATGKIDRKSVDKGVNYLLQTQREDGSWYESEFTGTGFPCHFFLKYHLYQQYFPLLALGRYEKYFLRSSGNR